MQDPKGKESISQENKIMKVFYPLARQNYINALEKAKNIIEALKSQVSSR